MKNMRNAFLLLALTTPFTSWSATAPIMANVQAESSETIFRWSKDRCFDEHTPDSPARAFRSNDGQVHLYATHFKNVPLTGSKINLVKPSCDAQFTGMFSVDPEKYNTRIWLQTFYSENDGKDIYSLASSDYHGKWFGKCAKNLNPNDNCWMGAIVLAHSTDGGKNFSMLPSPDHVIANSSEKYSPNIRGSIGFLTTSNIVKIDQYFYSLFYTSESSNQPSGNCLVRTENLSDPKSWRAWSGIAFDQTLYNPTDSSKRNNFCTPLKGLPYKIRSLLWHAPSHGYIVTFEKTQKNKNLPNQTDVTFSLAWSKDLKKWSNPMPIITLEGPNNCKSPQVAGAYPSIIDSESPDANFGTISNDAYLYYTKFNFQPNCRLTLDRDLVRIPIKLSPTHKQQNKNTKAHETQKL